MIAETHAVLVTKEELMRFHDPERIQGYCLSCPKHGRFWSCPPFEVSPLTQFPEWQAAMIICRKTPVAPVLTQEQLTESFLASRVEFAADLLEREGRRAGVTALVAGHCSGCVHCTREHGEPCCKPEGLRYSLEALGFDVTGLAEGLAGQKVHWPKSGLPDYLMTVGALLCPTAQVAGEFGAPHRVEAGC